MSKRVILSGLALLCVVLPALADATARRSFSFSYSTTIEPIPQGQGPVHIFLPLAAENQQQRIVSEQISADIDGVVETESDYGNRFWHGTVAVSDGQSIKVNITTQVERIGSRLQSPPSSRPLNEVERAHLAQFLEPNAKVVVGHSILDPILTEVRASTDTHNPVRLPRAIYDWVVNNVEYKKVGNGWGNGDTFWACNERYGNCTDFHALFTSLARSENIPARFEIGFPVPQDRAAGNVVGYHCWVQFYQPEVGWFPIDASEAFKHPDKRDYFFGTHPQDRIHFSTGRDLRLGPEHRGRPLNYFVYPYVEVGGAAWAGPIINNFSYAVAGAPLETGPTVASLQ